MKSLWRKFIEWLRGQIERKIEPVNPPIKPPVPPEATIAEWPNHYAAEWCRHDDGEEEYRWKELEAAKAAGANCIKFPCSPTLGEDFAIHLLHFRHPSRGTPDNPWFMADENWTVRAGKSGIVKWIFVMHPSYDRDAWINFTKDYTVENLQVIVDGKVVSKL